MSATSLSTITLNGITRDCLRPAELRNAAFAGQYDWDTLFYDVYRAGPHVVMQGPPLLNLLAGLQASTPLRGKFGWPWPSARHFGQKKRGEIWWRADADRVALDGPLGRFDIAVQPDGAALFAGKRVIFTLSKDNDLRWIADWVRFYRRIHGADAVLVHDNGSTAYTLEELQATLDEAAAGEMVALAISWPFRYGPQGGLAGMVGGIEPDWDSDFCQTGSLQHARFRFLRAARSVLNVDIDELVLGDGSIFAATESARSGFSKFPGKWIAAHAPGGAARETCRHADYTLAERPEEAACPPKWCLVPGKADRLADSWSVHNLFGAKANRQLSHTFTYRHLRAITTSWKPDRWAVELGDPASLRADAALVQAYAAAGLEPGG